MKKRTKKAKAIAWGWIALIAIALSIGIGIGILTDPLPQQLCANRLAQLGAPPGIDQYVCYGRRPN